MYFTSLKRILFPLVCVISLFLNIYFLSYSTAYRHDVNREINSADSIMISNTSELVNTMDSLKNHTDPLEVNNVVIRFVILPSVSCENRNVQLVICVPTGRDNFHARNMIRETWGSYANSSENEALLLFFVGLVETNGDPSTRRSQQFLAMESKYFGDIVQGDYKDSYRNLTLKSLSMLHWVTRFCPKSQFILKADDDMYVNIPLLVEALKNKTSKTNRFILGEALTAERPHRDPNSKWFVANSEYAEEMYPQFVLGPSYAMTTLAAKRLYHASRFVPLFFLEDVYITGLCAKKARVSVIRSELFSNYKRPTDGCTFRNHIAAHGYLPEEMAQIHIQLYDNTRHC